MLVAMVVWGCSKSGTENVLEGRYAETPGTVHQWEELWTLVPDADPSTRLCLDGGAVPDEVKVEGAKVVFSGKRLDPPENARMACNPLQLDAIALAH